MNSSSSPNVLVRNVSTRTRQPVRILAAIGSLDASSQLAERIITHAAQLAKQLGGELHVASAYPTLSGGAHSYRVARYLPALRVKVRDRQRCAVRQLLRRLNIAVATIHVDEGDACRVIEALESSLHASVVVEAQPDSNSSEAGTISARGSRRTDFAA